jgi:hypothetical protein
MVNRTVIPQELKPVSVLVPQVTGTGTEAYILPTGARTVYLVCHVTMGNSADLVLTPKTADDASGTSATALAANVPIWENTTRQTDAKAHTVDDSSGTFVVVFAIPADIIPTGKYVGMSYANSHNSSLLSCTAYVDYYHNAL